MAPERVLLFWSRRTEKLISDDVWQADRVIEVPDDVSTTVADAVAQRLTAVLHEELARCQQEKAELRLIPIGPPAFQGILEHVVSSVISPLGGGLVVVRSRVSRPNAPLVTVDHDTVNKVCKRFCDPDFSKPPVPDKRLFNDDLPATLEPPPGHERKEA